MSVALVMGSKRRKEPPIASCLSRSSQSSHGGVEQNYETPHTSFSIWVLLDEGTFFMCLPNNALCVKIPSVRRWGPPGSGNKETLALDLQENLPLAGFFVPCNSFKFSSIRPTLLVVQCLKGSCRNLSTSFLSSHQWQLRTPAGLLPVLG